MSSPPRDSARPAGQVWADAASCFRGWSEGDTGEAGLHGLVEVMTPVLWHVVRAYRLPPDLAEDVVQTTWLALVRRRDAIDDPVAVGGWLTTTARREAWRLSKVKAKSIPVDDEDIAVHLPRQRSAESEAVESDEQDRLWRAVDGLPERCRRLLRIVAFENRPNYTQVAETLDMPVGSIGPTRSRCLAKLRIALIGADSEALS
ncbi:sigma-70 family RNA polymerase sigma factor [Nocardioides sp. JQ2195]|uniref:RNA polymerase sigma factor n=1 Tax=Nocardioides sp. JQ2195 TaxID=2592334 RepID=UPI0019809214|nr:sigma-70 family RNA polymerase sigma factor [Nocardioides sp. JQ2195]